MKALELFGILSGKDLKPARTAEIVFREGEKVSFKVTLPLNSYKPRGFFFYDMPIILRKNGVDNWFHVTVQISQAEKADMKRVYYEKIEINPQSGEAQKTETREDHLKNEPRYFD